MATSPKFEMRVTPELREQINDAAKSRGMTAAKWVKEQINLGLHSSGEQRAPRDPYQGRLEADRVRRRAPQAENGVCKHRNKRRLSYVTLCDDCGARL